MRPTIAQLKPILKPAQVLLVSRAGVFPWAIKKVTGSIYTHAAIIDKTVGGIWVVIEAVAAGVVGRRFEHYLEDEHYTSLCLRDYYGAHDGLAPMFLADVEREQVCQSMWLQVGQGYDIPGLFGILAKDKLGLPITTQFDVAGRKFCSEAVSWSYKHALGVDLVSDEISELTSPGDLATTDKLKDVWQWHSQK